MPMFAPAETDRAPLDPFSNDTLFRALDDALMVRVSDPTPEALAREMLFPPTRANETAVPVTLVPPPLNDCVPAAPPPAAALITMLLPIPESVIFGPGRSQSVPVLDPEILEVAPPPAKEDMPTAAT